MSDNAAAPSGANAVVIDGLLIQPDAVYDVQFSDLVVWLGTEMPKQYRHHVRGEIVIANQNKVGHVVKSTIG